MSTANPELSCARTGAAPSAHSTGTEDPASSNASPTAVRASLMSKGRENCEVPWYWPRASPVASPARHSTVSCGCAFFVGRWRPMTSPDSLIPCALLITPSVGSRRVSVYSAAPRSGSAGAAAAAGGRTAAEESASALSALSAGTENEAEGRLRDMMTSNRQSGVDGARAADEPSAPDSKLADHRAHAPILICRYVDLCRYWQPLRSPASCAVTQRRCMIHSANLRSSIISIQGDRPWMCG